MGQPSGLGPAQAVIKGYAGQKGQPDLQGYPQGLGNNCPAGTQTEDIQPEDESGLRAEEPYLAQHRSKGGPASQDEDQDQKGADHDQAPGSGK